MAIQMRKVSPGAKDVAGFFVGLGLLAFAGGLTTSARAAVGDSYGSVAIVLSQSTRSLSIPTLELYRSVVDAAQASRRWEVAPTGEVSRQLPRPQALNRFGTIPVFSRSELIAAHPAAGKAKNGVPAKRDQHPVIPPVQTMLDTLALQGAVIVDCIPKGAREVSGCGLYYYDRGKGRVTASTRKYFRTGVANATRWSGTLVASLAAGMQAAAVAKDKEKLQEVLTKSEEEQPKRWTLVEVQGFGQSLSGPADGILSFPKGFPGASLRMGRQAENFGLGLEVSYGSASDRSRDHSLTYRERSASLSFTTEAHALSSIAWDLNLGIGYALRQASSHMDGIAADAVASLISRDVKLQVAPGLMWEWSDRWSIGMQLRLIRYQTLERDGEARFANGRFNRAASGLALRVKSLF